MTTTPLPRRKDEARTSMQSSRRRVSGTLSLPCSTRWCAVLTRPASARLWRISAEARTKGDPELLKNLFVLAFQTRWCRGGKGERNVFYHLLVALYERYAAVLVDLVELIPTHGAWRDLLNLSPRVQSWQRGLCPLASQGVEHVCTPVEGRQGGARCSNVSRA